VDFVGQQTMSLHMSTPVPPTMAEPKHRREVGRWRMIACVLLLIALALLVAISVILVKIHTDTDKPTCGNPDTSKYCHVDQEGSATSKYGHVDLEESTTPSEH
jgi:hypothetical protein